MTGTASGGPIGPRKLSQPVDTPVTTTTDANDDAPGANADPTGEPDDQADEDGKTDVAKPKRMANGGGGANADADQPAVPSAEALVTDDNADANTAYSTGYSNDYAPVPSTEPIIVAVADVQAHPSAEDEAQSTIVAYGDKLAHIDVPALVNAFYNCMKHQHFTLALVTNCFNESVK